MIVSVTGEYYGQIQLTTRHRLDPAIKNWSAPLQAGCIAFAVSHLKEALRSVFNASKTRSFLCSFSLPRYRLSTTIFDPVPPAPIICTVLSPVRRPSFLAFPLIEIELFEMLVIKLERSTLLIITRGAEPKPLP